MTIDPESLAELKREAEKIPPQQREVAGMMMARAWGRRGISAPQG
jgi:hypothetical protein